MNFPSNLKYAESHEWVKVDGDIAIIGITAYAADQLGDIVFWDIPSVGENIEKEDTFGSVEAVKTVSDLFMPVGGERRTRSKPRTRKHRPIRSRLGYQG